MTKSTVKGAARYGDLFCSFMEGKELHPVTMAAWSMWVRNQSQFSSGYVREMNGRVRTFLRWLKSIRHTDEDLSSFVELPPPNPLKPIRVFTEEEYEKLKHACRHPCYQAFLWLIILAYRTGMHLVDCCYLRWAHVHLDDDGPSYIEVPRRKTARYGIICRIPIVPFSDLHQWLVRMKKSAHLNYKRYDGINDYVHQDTTAIYESMRVTAHQRFKWLLLDAGIPCTGITFGTFRKTFISNLVNSGGQSDLICKMSGHSDGRMLRYYLKEDRRAMETQLVNAFTYAKQQCKSTTGVTVIEPAVANPPA